MRLTSIMCRLKSMRDSQVFGYLTYSCLGNHEISMDDGIWQDMDSMMAHGYTNARARYTINMKILNLIVEEL